MLSMKNVLILGPCLHPQPPNPQESNEWNVKTDLSAESAIICTCI